MSRADVARCLGGAPGLFHASEKRRIGRLGKRGAGEIVIARPFIAKRAIDEDKIRRGPNRSNLASGRHADKEPATGCEKLLGDQDREWCADGAADDANSSDAFEIEARSSV